MGQLLSASRDARILTRIPCPVHSVGFTWGSFEDISTACRPQAASRIPQHLKIGSLGISVPLPIAVGTLGSHACALVTHRRTNLPQETGCCHGDTWKPPPTFCSRHPWGNTDLETAHIQLCASQPRSRPPQPPSRHPSFAPASSGIPWPHLCPSWEGGREGGRGDMASCLQQRF